MKSIDTELADELWQEFYRKNGRVWLTVKSGSMLPLIRPQDRVLMCRAAAGQLHRGDVTVFKRSGSLIAHRVLKELHTDGGACFIEKGDNADGWGEFRADDFIGRITRVRSGNRVFVLDSRSGRLAGRVLAAWFYGTGTVVKRLKSSPGIVTRKTGGAIRRLSIVPSAILLRLCCAVWRLSGLRNRETAG